MSIKDIISFDPINLTSIITTLMVLGILLMVFDKQLKRFMDNLETIQFNVKEGSISLTAKPRLEPLADATSNFNENIESLAPIDEFRKSTYADLHQTLEQMGDNLGVLRYAVNTDVNYYSDDGMLKYLSIASEKVKFIAFYEDETFKGAIEIEKVIAGIANGQYQYTNFGFKLRTGEWQSFPALIAEDDVFIAKPDIKTLYERLSQTGLSAIPLLENNRLVGFLDYKSITEQMYSQVKA